MKNRYHLLLSAILLATAAFGGTGKLSPDISTITAQDTPRDVIIRYTSSPTTLDHDIVIRAGGILIRTLPAIDAAVYTVPPSALMPLAEQPRVLRITADRKVQPRLDYTAAAVG